MNEKLLLALKVALLIIVLAPLAGLGLSQQEWAIWLAALAALVVLVVRSRRGTPQTESS
jgi:hypothetical protein